MQVKVQAMMEKSLKKVSGKINKVLNWYNQIGAGIAQ